MRVFYVRYVLKAAVSALNPGHLQSSARRLHSRVARHQVTPFPPALIKLMFTARGRHTPFLATLWAPGSWQRPPRSCCGAQTARRRPRRSSLRPTGWWCLVQCRLPSRFLPAACPLLQHSGHTHLCRAWHRLAHRADAGLRHLSPLPPPHTHTQTCTIHDIQRTVRRTWLALPTTSIPLCCMHSTTTRFGLPLRYAGMLRL